VADLLCFRMAASTVRVAANKTAQCPLTPIDKQTARPQSRRRQPPSPQTELWKPVKKA